MELKGRSTDQWGNVVFDAKGLVNHLMSGREIAQDMTCHPSPQVETFNRLCRTFDHPEHQVGLYAPPQVSLAQWDDEHQRQWFIPEPYLSMDVKEWLLMRCQREDEVLRVLEEWEMFLVRDMVEVLRCLIYLVDSFRQDGVVWGVGRGSSVASYCLYLIGIHRVDSLRFGLDLGEFLK